MSCQLTHRCSQTSFLSLLRIIILLSRSLFLPSHSLFIKFFPTFWINNTSWYTFCQEGNLKGKEIQDRLLLPCLISLLSPLLVITIFFIFFYICSLLLKPQGGQPLFPSLEKVLSSSSDSFLIPLFSHICTQSVIWVFYFYTWRESGMKSHCILLACLKHHFMTQ